MVTKRQIEKTTVYPLFSLFTQFSAVAMSIRYSAGCDYLGEMRNYWEDGTLRISHRQDRRITDTKKLTARCVVKCEDSLWTVRGIRQLNFKVMRQHLLYKVTETLEQRRNIPVPKPESLPPWSSYQRDTGDILYKTVQNSLW